LEARRAIIKIRKKEEIEEKKNLVRRVKLKEEEKGRARLSPANKLPSRFLTSSSLSRSFALLNLFYITPSLK